MAQMIMFDVILLDPFMAVFLAVEPQYPLCSMDWRGLVSDLQWNSWHKTGTPLP